MYLTGWPHPRAFRQTWRFTTLLKRIDHAVSLALLAQYQYPALLLRPQLERRAIRRASTLPPHPLRTPMSSICKEGTAYLYQ